MWGPTPPKKFKYSESDNEFPPGDFDNKPTPSSGLKLIQHGDDYQLLLHCLCLWRVLESRILDFLLATELQKAEKFDHVVIKYKHENRLVLSFSQAKHKEPPRPTDSIHKITLTDLLTSNTSGEFNLLEYFRSIVKILEDPSRDSLPALLVEKHAQDYLLRGKIGYIWRYSHGNMNKKDFLRKGKVFGVPTEQTNSQEPEKELKILMYTRSDFDELISNLANCLLFGSRLDTFSWIFAEYYYPLAKHVLEFAKVSYLPESYEAKFLDTFKNANSQRTANVEEFRKPFIKEVAFRMIFFKLTDVELHWKREVKYRKLLKEFKSFADQSKTAVYSALRQDETLFHEVVDDKTEEIRNDFVSGTEKLSPKVQLFRKKLVDEVVDGNMAENVFDKVSGQTFLVTRHATRLEPKSNPKIEDVEVFAKDIADLIDKCTGFTNYKTIKLRETLPSPVMKESIDDFCLIVKFPNRRERREVENQNLNSKAIVDSLVQEIYQRMMHRLGTFYNPEKVEMQLARLDKDLTFCELDITNRSFCMALPTKYKFDCGELMAQIKDFLQQSHSSVLLLRAENLTLCCVRFLQAFWSLQEENQDANGELPFYLRQFGYLFITIRRFLDKTFREKLIRRNQDKDQFNLRLVKCCTENLSEAEEFRMMQISFQTSIQTEIDESMLDLAGSEKFESILDLLFESSDSPSVARKVIFIVEEDTSEKLRSALDSYFKKQGNTNFEPSTFELKTTFSHLQTTSQDELLKNGQIRLHGHDYQFGDIVNQDTVHLIDETTLANLIKGFSLISIGRINKRGDCNIDRCAFESRLKASIHLLTKQGEEGRDIVIVADSRDEFNEIKDRLMENQKYFAPQSIHWFREAKHDIDRFPWDSIKSFSSLHRYGTNACFLTQEKLLESVKDRKIVILHGVPGSGKALLLENLLLNMTNNSQLLWKIYINLKRYTDFFKKKQKEPGNRANMSTSECSEFLLELFQSDIDTRLDSQLEINFLRSAFQREIAGKIRLVLFLDGFDEISPNYKDIVLDFLLSSKACSGSLQMFIITRSENYEYLEQKLEAFSLRYDAVSDTKNSL
ncbi:unnamed protein product [Hermetia illucens]|uniref:NACHT domain-containing protein n=1 Tax=Hermetia illucens TaxID=343691 RepID=A0A7R8UTF0_HERIL|nr:unnamed protein product [Hermetia illucens]